MKKCSTCLKLKPLKEFHKASHHGDGRASSCAECCSIKRLSAFTSERRDAHNKRNREYYAQNLDKQRARGRLKAQTYKDRLSAYKKEWAMINRDKRNAQQLKRTAIKLSAMPTWLNEEQLMRVSCFYTTAAYLTLLHGVQIDVDHIEPLRGKDVCGLHVPWNLQLLSHKDNISKGNRRLTK